MAVPWLVCSLWLITVPPAGAAVPGADAGSYSIGRANNDGSGIQPGFVIGLPSHPGSLAVDGGHIYWAAYPRRAIGRASLDGSGVDPSFITLDSTTTAPWGDVAVGGGRIYWYWFVPFGPAYIGRANVDGSAVEPRFIEGGRERLAVDPSHIYWAGWDGIGRANLDGSGVEHLITRSGVGGVAIDGAYLYWTRGDSIGRANLNGSDVYEHWISGIGSPGLLAVRGGHIYWIDWRSTNAIGRANLDGTRVQRRFITMPWRDFTALEVDGAHLYWSSNPPTPMLLTLRISPPTFALGGRRVTGRCVATTRANRRQPACTRQIRLRVTYRVNVATRTQFKIVRRVPGRMLRGNCVPVTPAIRTNASCTRSVGVPGIITRTSTVGHNSFIFNGWIAGHELTPGLYQLRAYDGYGSKIASFQITR